MTKLLLAAVTLFLSVGTVVEGLGDENTKRLRGRVLGDTCNFDFSKASSGTTEYSMNVALGYESSYIKLTVADGPFKGIFKAWCIDHLRHIGLKNYAADIASVFDPKLQPGGIYPDAVDKPENIRSLAWLINNYKIGDMYRGSNCNAQITMGDMQNAIWNIIDVNNSYKGGATSGYGFPKNICISEQLAAEAIATGKNYQLDCNDPNEQIPIVFVVDDISNKIQNQVLMAQFYVSEIQGLGPPPATRTLNTYECPAGSTKVKVDFNAYTSGLYLRNLTNTLSVTAVGNGAAYTPDGKARIFDSKKPTGSVDLGSPNYACDISGPGQGEGGRKGRPGENCKALDKLLIIQEGNKVEPDANNAGGKFTFKTNGKTEVTLVKAGVLDMDEATVTIGTSSPLKFAGVGDNGFQEIVNPVLKNFATSFDVATPGSGALAYLEICERTLDLCPNDNTKTEPGVCGCGVSDVDTDMDGTPDCLDECPMDATKTKPGTCGCGKPDVDTDGDGVMDCNDRCPNDKNKIMPGVCGCGVSEMDTDGDGTPDCTDKCPADALKTEPGKCGCGIADMDSDGDGILDCNDKCPNNAMKTQPGVCGCDMADTDSDGDGAPDCVDECPKDASKTVAGVCGCGVSDMDSDMDGTLDCLDKCPMDAEKTEPGACGCGVPDTDTDMDGTPDCLDECPEDADKTEPGTCGCGVSDKDSDGDGTPDCIDLCPNDKDKTEPGQCGCGNSEMDSDGDGTADCKDLCPHDKNKVMPGTCGCGHSDVDTDGDGTSDCIDGCPLDKEKTEKGICGCGMKDWDSDFDGTPDCLDLCPSSTKTEPGICGCDVPDVDTDKDGVMDCQDGCPMDASKVEPSVCGCGTPDVDTDGDGVMDCQDLCPNDKEKSEPGVCGCGVSDMDSDDDGVLDCNDKCPEDADKTEPGVCGCGVSDMDSDGDGILDCNDECPMDADKTEPGACGCGVSDKDSDSDGTPDCNDECPEDADKTEPGACGCGVSDIDTDGDGTPDCQETNPPAPDAPTPEDKKSDKAFTKGDPHFKTFGGEMYDFHGECDLVLLHNPEFNNNMGMDIHIRTKIESFWSSVESAAMRIGDSTIEIKAAPDSNEWLWIDGELVSATVETGEWYRAELAGFLVRYKETKNAGREVNIYVNKKGSRKGIQFKTYKSFVRADIDWQGSSMYDNSLGLLGSRALDGQRVARDGQTHIKDVNKFGQEWQVLESEPKLFHSYEGAVVGQKCIMPPAFDSPAQQRRLAESNMTQADAKKACNHLIDPEEIDACVFDVLATQDLDMASSW